MTWLGYIAGAFVTLSLIPQIVRIFKIKSAHDISIVFNSLLLIGILLWLAYGIALKLTPVIIWNAIGAFLTSILLYAKLKYGR